jgi:septal ring factor EnvC (AmiA/AmiB activator)
MPSAQLKRAERAIAAIREQAELPPETAVALDEIVAAIRSVEGRLVALESKSRARRSF